MEPEDMMLNGDCEGCDQDPTQCINQGYCHFDKPSDLVDTEDLNNAVDKILNYMWVDELNDWRECGKPTSNHIFNELIILAKGFNLIDNFKHTLKD